MTRRIFTSVPNSPINKDLYTGANSQVEIKMNQVFFELLGDKFHRMKS